MLTRQRFLMPAFGSLGDVLPCCALGRWLARHGHDVTVASFPQYRQLVEDLALGFTPLGPSALWEGFRDDPRAWDPGFGLECYFARVIGPMVAPTARLIRDAVAADPGVVVLASILALGAGIAWHERPFRWATCNPYPVFFPSIARPPVLPRCKRYDPASGRVPLFPHALANALGDRLLGPPERNPRIVLSRRAAPWKKWLQWKLSGRVLDALLRPHVAALAGTASRARDGRGLFARHAFSPELTLALFPDWFAPRQDDWPPGNVSGTFPELGDGRAPPSVELRRFLAAGPPPVVCTFGSHKRHSLSLFTQAATAAVAAGFRAVLVTAEAADIPRELPPEVLHCRFEPLPWLLRRAALVVHHAGIGTTADALAAGIPQILVPFTYDQPDNATRLVRLGVGRILPPGLLTPQRLAEQITAATTSPEMERNCRLLARRLAVEDREALLTGPIFAWLARRQSRS